MNAILQIQKILGTQPDGIWGPRSAAALGTSDVDMKQRIQTVLGVTADGVWGPASQAALDGLVNLSRVTQPWPFSARVDGDDLVVEDITITCFGGGFDPQDNGDTASGVNTKTSPIRGVSVAMDGRQFSHLSRPEHAALDGAPLPKMPWGTLVEVTINGDTYTPPAGIIDLGPGHQASHPHDPHALDLTPLAASHFAPNTPIERLARTFSARGSFRVLCGAKYLPLLFLAFLFMAGAAYAGFGGPSPSSVKNITLGGVGSAATAFLADGIPDLSSPTFGLWLKDLVMAAALFFFLLGGVEKIKAVFGRTPPVTEEIKALEKKIDESDRRRSVGVAGAHAEADRHAIELRGEISAIKDQLAEIEKVNATLDERTKTTNHTIDSMNLKMDQLLRTPVRRA